MEGEATVTISTVLTNWTTIVNSVMNIVTGKAILFTMLSIGLVGGGIGLVKRLF